MLMDTNEVKEHICGYLKEGMYKKDAAVMAGISEATLHRWLKEDESFESQVVASILEYKRTLIRIVTACAEKDGRLALEVLKRRFPNDWNGTNDDENAIGRTTNQEVAELFQQILHRRDSHETVEPTISPQDNATGVDVPVQIS